jgi:hypothetical protein
VRDRRKRLVLVELGGLGKSSRSVEEFWKFSRRTVLKEHRGGRQPITVEALVKRHRIPMALWSKSRRNS